MKEDTHTHTHKCARKHINTHANTQTWTQTRTRTHTKPQAWADCIAVMLSEKTMVWLLMWHIIMLQIKSNIICFITVLYAIESSPYFRVCVYKKNIIDENVMKF